MLRTYTRLGRIGAEDGIAMLRQGLAMVRQGLAMVTFCAECDDDLVLAEANASNLTLYDAAYAARARTLGVKLYTRDGDILRNCPEIAVPIAQI